jgi:hypothetical protein
LSRNILVMVITLQLYCLHEAPEGRMHEDMEG